MLRLQMKFEIYTNYFNILSSGFIIRDNYNIKHKLCGGRVTVVSLFLIIRQLLGKLLIDILPFGYTSGFHQAMLNVEGLSTQAQIMIFQILPLLLLPLSINSHNLTTVRSIP